MPRIYAPDLTPATVAAIAASPMFAGAVVTFGPGVTDDVLVSLARTFAHLFRDARAAAPSPEVLRQAERTRAFHLAFVDDDPDDLDAHTEAAIVRASLPPRPGVG